MNSITYIILAFSDVDYTKDVKTLFRERVEGNDELEHALKLFDKKQQVVFEKIEVHDSEEPVDGRNLTAFICELGSGGKLALDVFLNGHGPARTKTFPFPKTLKGKVTFAEFCYSIEEKEVDLTHLGSELRKEESEDLIATYIDLAIIGKIRFTGSFSIKKK